jgi:cellulose synthase (UDP-forming)
MLFALIAGTLLLTVLYGWFRLTTVLTSGYRPGDAVMAGLLFAAEIFLCIHGVGYFSSLVKAERQLGFTSPVLFAQHLARRGSGGRASLPPVAILVAAFNESVDVLEETLASVCAMDYPAARVYLLDDSTKAECREGSARLAALYGVQLVHRTNRQGYKAGAINDLIPSLEEPYIALLDADQRPRVGWLSELIPYMEAHPELAFVQTPQIYVNTEGLRVAETAAHQQAVFFEYICEGKSYSNAMFCCGSNVILRRDALLSVATTERGRQQYFDETSVTEDFATSFRLHLKGWKTAYINQPYVFGMGPETLPAYFTQQMRWAMGTLGVGLRVAGHFFRHPRALRAAQWWEYLLSGSYYFVGIASLIFILAPVLFVTLGVRPLRNQSMMYFVLFPPYIMFTMGLFFLGMRRRGYGLRGVWLASALSFGTCWTYARAAIVAVLGLKRAFGVTPKGVGGAIPLSRMAGELSLCLASAGTALWGTAHLAILGWDFAYAINTFWAAYHATVLSALFLYFNRPVQVEARPLLFQAPAGSLD